MALNLITFADKSDINNNESTPIQNKITGDNCNEIKTVVNAGVNQINNLTGQILWTNSDPTSNFSSQTITLSSDDYDVLEIFFAYTTGGTRTTSHRFLKGTGASLEIFFDINVGSSQSTSFAQRLISYSNDTSLDITDCGKRTGAGPSTPDVSNNMVIPLYVVGYKTGLF